MTVQETDSYKRFMCDPNNTLRCAECPANVGAEDGFTRQYPCGQQNCWVECHCNDNDRREN
jgi:hypothetical protein